MSEETIYSTGVHEHVIKDMRGELENPKRRDFLMTLTGVATTVGLGAACVPFISSMKPGADVMSKATVEVEIGDIPRGESRTVEWQGKPVFVLHRSEEQIRAMLATNNGKDAQTDQDRVLKPEWLVVVGLCTHLGCIPNRTDDGWLCPCHGSAYDNSGRILYGPAPKNLEVPRYDFVSDRKILIG